MHPFFSLVTDQSSSWVGLIWPETLLDTTPSPRIRNSPDLPNDGETYGIIFAFNLDAKLYSIMADLLAD